MDKFITVPILANGFQSNEQIGTLSILKDKLPNHTNFVFSIAYRIEENQSYELKAVSIIPDEEFIAYLKEQDDK